MNTGCMLGFTAIMENAFIYYLYVVYITTLTVPKIIRRQMVI
jgi:hypothetical protein